MVPDELTEQVRTEVRRMKEVHGDFLQTYQRLCAHCGGPDWHKKDELERVFHQVRREIVPIMQQAGLDPKDVDALCSWAAKRLTND
jgi:hypothetical protein